MMNNQDWLKFYRNWEYNQLLQEIETCHKFQQDILMRVSQRLIDGSGGLSLLVQSQQREALINEIIREKVKDQNV